MYQLIKNFIKQNEFFRNIIWRIKHPVVKTKKLSNNINSLFNNLESSKEIFNKKLRIQNLIVSLTSFPARIKYLEYTLFSLINQSIIPEKIILWLSEEEFSNKENDLPNNLKYFCYFNLEIKFIKENYKSYKKLIYSLEKYPNYIIVTVDDDIFYKSKWLELLYNTHILYPNEIIAHKVHRITFTKNNINSYRQWKNNTINSSFLNFAVGYGGILYPPKSLYKDINNSSLFLKLCPHSDDIWFYVMELLAHTKIRKTKCITSKILSFDYLIQDDYKNVPQLFDINYNNNENDHQLNAVLSYYGIFNNFYQFIQDKYNE